MIPLPIYTVIFLCHYPEHLLRGKFHILKRDILTHCFRKWHHTRQNREYAIDKRWILQGSACTGMFDASGKHDDFAAAGFGTAGDTDRSLAHRGLSIESSLSGYDNISGAKLCFRKDGIKYDIYARFEACPAGRMRKRTRVLLRLRLPADCEDRAPVWMP